MNRAGWVTRYCVLDVAADFSQMFLIAVAAAKNSFSKPLQREFVSTHRIKYRRSGSLVRRAQHLRCESSNETAVIYKYSSFALMLGVIPYSTPAPAVAPRR